MPPRIKGWLDDGHLEELLRVAAPDPPLGLAVSLMCDAGCRLREALAFDVRSLSQGNLRIYATKTRKWRTVPIPRRLELAIAAAVDRQGEVGSPSVLPFTPRTLQRRLFDLCHRAATPVTSPHRLRHSYATRLHAEGVPLATISALLGHINVAVTLIYLHVGEHDYDEAKKALDRRALRARPRRRKPRRSPRSGPDSAT